MNQATLSALGGGGYQRQLPDGSAENYTLSVSDDGLTYWLMTSLVDPQGNFVAINWVPSGSGYRVNSIVDANGQVTTFYYGTSDNFLLTSVVDPSGHTATFAYDATDTYLTSITDRWRKRFTICI